MPDVTKKDKIPEAYSEPSQTSKMERFGKIADGQKPVIIFTKRCILDV